MGQGDKVAENGAVRTCELFTLLPLNPAEILQSLRGLCRLCPARLFLHAANAALRCQSNKADRSSWAHDDGVVGTDL
jgi:hypothetical protein